MSKQSWRPWITPKIAGLMWKLFHRVIPSDDNIARLTIPIVSRCACCSRPSLETTDHIFFHGDWARLVWCKLSRIFDRPKPMGRNSLLRFWLLGKKHSFLDCLASGMASCALWELWKARNGKIHDTHNPPLWYACLRWAPKIAAIIRAVFVPSFHGSTVLRALGVRQPNSTQERLIWYSWRPPDVGYSLDMDFHPYGLDYVTCGILRDRCGLFIAAAKFFTTAGSSLEILDKPIQELFTLWPTFFADISVIRSSHFAFWAFANPDQLIPATEHHIYHNIINRYRGVTFKRIFPCQNIAASTLLHTCEIGSYRDTRNFPIAAIRAIRSDACVFQLPLVLFRRPCRTIWLCRGLDFLFWMF